MSLPEANVFVENLSPDANVSLRQVGGGNEVYIHTDDDGNEAVVCMDGRKQLDQQKQLNTMVEMTKRRTMYAKGYRYHMTPIGHPKFEPLIVKSTQDAARLMREDYPKRKFTILKLLPNGRLRSRR